MTLASTAPIASRPVLISGRAVRGCRATRMPPATVNSANSRMMNGMYSRSSVCSDAVGRRRSACGRRPAGRSTSAAQKAANLAVVMFPDMRDRAAARWRSTAAGRQTAAPTAATSRRRAARVPRPLAVRPGNSIGTAMPAPAITPAVIREKPPMPHRRSVRQLVFERHAGVAHALQHRVERAVEIDARGRRRAARSSETRRTASSAEKATQKSVARPASVTRVDAALAADSRRGRSASCGRSRRRPNSCRCRWRKPLRITSSALVQSSAGWKAAPARALHAMVRPQRLLRHRASRSSRTAACRDGCEAKLEWPGGMPVLRQHDMLEARGSSR